MALPNALSTEKSTSGIKVALHPLVILTISDYITRHTLRNQPGPLIGALLGQQNGEQISVEHAFEVNALKGEVDATWFTARLEDMKAVHKSPPLDFIGIYTLLPSTGPTSHHTSLINKFGTLVPDASDILLLGFHPQDALTHSTSGSLPVSIYEPCRDPGHDVPESLWNGGGGADVLMGGQGDIGTDPHFHTLGYTIESGEAERIAVDFVAKGGGNAQAVATAEVKTTPAKGGEPMTSTKKRAADTSSTKASTEKGKEKEKEEVDANTLLRPDEAEMIAALSAKANAVRMLHSRISLMSDYISEFEGQKSNIDERNPEIMRSISALLARLPLLVPSSTDANGETTTEAFDKEQAKQREDVQLVGLLAKMTESVAETKELGKKFATLNQQKKSGKTEFDASPNLSGGLDEYQGRSNRRGSMGRGTTTFK